MESRLDLGSIEYLRLVEGIVDYAIYMIDPDGRVATWNAGARRIKGYPDEDVIGKPFSMFYLPEDIEAGKPELEMETALREGRAEEEGWRVRKDGTRFWANVVLTPLWDDDGSLRGFAKVTRDLTERRAAEDALRISEEKFRLLVESVLDYAIFMLDPNGVVASWNAGAKRIKGYSAEEIIGSHFSRFYPPEDVASRKPEWELDVATREGRVEDEGWRVRKDGTRFWANVIITALRNEHGKLVGFAKVTRDLTERRRAEQFRDRFVANAAHEIRTPLTSVKGFAEVLMHRDQLPPGGEEQAIEALNRGADRLSLLVQNLLDLTRLEQASLDFKPEMTPLRTMIEETLEAAPPPAGHEVNTQGDLDVKAFVDPVRFIQVLTNLLSNAYRYGGSNITIEVIATPRRIDLSVSDDGSGVSPDIRAAMFEPFVRGNETGSTTGSGLGLSIARSMIDSMGGELTYEPGDPTGSRFLISLPRR